MPLATRAAIKKAGADRRDETHRDEGKTGLRNKVPKYWATIATGVVLGESCDVRHSPRFPSACISQSPWNRPELGGITWAALGQFLVISGLKDCPFSGMRGRSEGHAVCSGTRRAHVAASGGRPGISRARLQ